MISQVVRSPHLCQSITNSKISQTVMRSLLIKIGMMIVVTILIISIIIMMMILKACNHTDNQNDDDT